MNELYSFESLFKAISEKLMIIIINYSQSKKHVTIRIIFLILIIKNPIDHRTLILVYTRKNFLKTSTTLGRIGSMKRPFQEFWDLPWEACLSIPA